MTTEPVVPVNKRVKPPQLTRADLKGLTPEEINQARNAGQLQDLLSGVKEPPPPAPPFKSDRERIAELLKGQL